MPQSTKTREPYYRQGSWNPWAGRKFKGGGVHPTSFDRALDYAAALYLANCGRYPVLIIHPEKRAA